MIIAIDLTSLSYHMSGIERYALCITKELLKIDGDNKYVLVFRNEVYKDLAEFVDGSRVCARIISGENKLIFNQVILPIELSKIKADRYLFLAFANPILFRHKGIISALHDMGAYDFSENDSFLKKVYFRTGCRAAVANSKWIVTVSEFSKKRICELLKVDEQKVLVAPNGVSSTLTNAEVKEFGYIQDKYGIPQNYVMTLSTVEPRKNMKLLIDAFADIKASVDYDVVLVGRKGWQVDEMIAEAGLDNRVHFTGFVDDEDVVAIYKNAQCFIFPSLYEGFGVPPLEALTLGTPVISSDAASMPEVLRKQAKYFKSNDKTELAEILININEYIKELPNTLDEYQKSNYRFDASAQKIYDLLLM